MALTSDQLTDLRADLGDQIEPYAFGDEELERLFVRAEGNYQATLLIAINQLLMNAAKFYNYAAGYTRQEQAVIFDHLKDLRDMLISNENGAIITGTAIVPTKHKDVPRG